MSDTLATYPHASLYSFSQRAREEILQEFLRDIADVTINCCYDVDGDSFEIRCPSVKGPHANEVLTRIINRRIEQHEDAGMNEEESDLVRFPESKFDALDSFVESNAESVMRPQPVDQRSIARTHIIIANVELLKVFRIHDLDEFGLLERTLAASTPKMESLFSSGLTCRATRFDPNDGYVFNGRTGRTGKHSLIGNGSNIGSSTLMLPGFGVLQDHRVITAEISVNPVTDDWELEPADEDVGVSKWLAGVGRTREVQVDPLSERADVPKDTRQMLAKEQAHATSRPRVARGMNIISSDTEESEDDSNSDDGLAGDFNTFLKTRRLREDSDESGSQGSDETQKGPSFQSLLPSGTLTAKKRRESGDWSAVVAKPATATRQRVGLQSTRSTEQSPIQSLESKPKSQELIETRTIDPTPSNLEPDRAWAEYGSQYAKVDSIGLMGNATNNAKWHAEQYNIDDEAQKQQLRPRPVMVRSIAPSISSLPPSPGGTSLASMGAAVPSSARSTTVSVSEISTASPAKVIRRYEDWDPSEAEWKNPPGPVTMQTSNHKLIDTHHGPSPAPMRVPPGYHHRPEPDVQIQRQTPVAMGNLIDIDENSSDHVQSGKPAQARKRETKYKR